MACLAETLLEGTESLRLPPPTFPDAVVLLEQGRPAAALARLEAQLGPLSPATPIEARILRAHLLEQIDRAIEAETAWRSVATDEPSIAEFATRRLVASLARRDQAVDAERWLATLLARPGSEAPIELMLDVASAYQRTGNLATAVALHRQALAVARAGPLADRVRLSLATVLEISGDLEAALAVYREAALAHRTLDTYRTAREGERRLAARVGRSTEWSEAQYRGLVERLRAGSHFGTALEVLDEWRARYPTGAAPDLWEALVVETLYDQRANRDALARAQAFFQHFPSSPLGPRVRLTELRLHLREGRTAQVWDLGKRLWGDGTTAPPGVPGAVRWQAGLLLAAYLTGAGEYGKALAYYDALAREAPDPETRRLMRWRGAVAALAAGERARARADLEALLALRPDVELERAARYWLAALDAREHRHETARRRWQALWKERPFDYYGLRAARRLGDAARAEAAPDVTRRAAAIPAVLAEPTAGHPRYRAATILARAGLSREALAELRALLRGDGRRDRALALVTVRAAARLNEYPLVLGLVATYFPPERAAETVWPADLWPLAYPRPFWREVLAAAQPRRVDPLLLLALMRQESRFDPAARSAVGALGLFQIMPATARQLWPELGGARGTLNGTEAPEPSFHTAVLRPSVNAALAATLVAHLTSRFGGALVPAIAAYNAGDDRVQAWWDAARELEEDLFVETIPYSETRQFVKAVLTNYWTYQRLYPATE